jgi:hypothetical protein
MLDRAFDQLKSTVPAGAGVAAIWKPKPRPQRGAQDRVVIGALVFANSVDLD